MQLENDHNVYVLGAGFSREAGLPLISDFLLQMRDSHEWLQTQGREAEAKAVSRVLEFRLAATSAAYWVNLDLENIEELFSLASASSGGMDQNVRLAIAATLDFARARQPSPRREMLIQGKSAVFKDTSDGKPLHRPRWAKPKTPRGQPTSGIAGPYDISLYAYYVARLLGMFEDVEGNPKGQNTFISFNYDTLVEEALRELEIQFCYGFKPGTVNFDPSAAREGADSDVHLLKLHGSVNWARPKAKRNRLTVYGDYDDVRKSGAVPELVPPTWKKVFENQMEAVWERAVERLNSATRIVIIGFSMPPTDMHFKYLIAAGLQNNISLRQILFVKPDAEELAGRVGVVLRKAYIDSHKIGFASEELYRFLLSSGSHSKIGRPLEKGIEPIIKDP